VRALEFAPVTTPKDIPLNLREEYQWLQEQNDTIIDKAEALGWRPEE
jgi:hypothetical protein